jgi:hypothetical protein
LSVVGVTYQHYTEHCTRLKRRTLSRAAFETCNAMASAYAAASILDELDAGDVEWEAQVWGENIAEDLKAKDDAAAAPPAPRPQSSPHVEAPRPAKKQKRRRPAA